MSKRAKRGLAAVLALGVVIGIGVAAAFFTGTPRTRAAAAQALPDVGRFRVGSVLGEERAGFSGRAQVQVFASAPSADWPAISACLESSAVVAEMDFFTGVLIDEALEPEVDATLREEGVRVIVLGLQGQILGLLHAGFACEDFVNLLARVRTTSTRGPEKSPIYANLLESAGPVDWLIQNGEAAKAEKFVGFFEEFEGSASPAVQAAKARLGS